jgi:DNA-binding protein YbaB
VIENLTEEVEPFTTTTKTKTQAIQALQLLVQQGRFKHHEEQLDREMSLYQWDDKDLIQDSVMSAAIAAYQAIERGGELQWIA